MRCDFNIIFFRHAGGSSNGGRQSNWKPNEFTILDIVYNDASKTCFILDLIYWRSRPYYDSVTAFRFFWLKTQFAECETELTFKERKVSPFVYQPLSLCRVTTNSFIVGTHQLMLMPVVIIEQYSHKEMF